MKPLNYSRRVLGHIFTGNLLTFNGNEFLYKMVIIYTWLNKYLPLLIF